MGRGLCLPGCPCNVGAAVHVFPDVEVGGGRFQYCVWLPFSDHSLQGAFIAHPPPGPPPDLEINVEQGTQGAACVLDAGRHESAAGHKRVQGTLDGGGHIEDFGDEEGQYGIDGTGNFYGIGVALYEGDVAPVPELDSLTGELEHLGAEFYADDASLGSNVSVKPFEADAGAAAQVQH